MQYESVKLHQSTSNVQLADLTSISSVSKSKAEKVITPKINILNGIQIQGWNLSTTKRSMILALFIILVIYTFIDFYVYFDDTTLFQDFLFATLSLMGLQLVLNNILEAILINYFKLDKKIFENTCGIRE
eukprot:70892_1